MSNLVGVLLAIGVIVGTVVLVGFAVGAFFALPMIWFHSGHASRKLDKLELKLASIESILRNK